jgi:hypothetical protein
VFLDSSLTPPEVDEDLKKKGVSGELWAVHGGGLLQPGQNTWWRRRSSHPLHWFYWESYSTWLSGFSLFTVSYLWSAGTYLIDKSLMDWSPAAAIAVALAFWWCSGCCMTPSAAPSASAQEWRRHRGRAGVRAGVARLLAGLPLVCRARGLPAGGRDDGHQP